MSNKKLGAEPGLEFDFEAIGDAIDRVLAGQRELTPAEQKNLRGIYSKLFTKLKPEQVYHARGAGRDLGKRIELFISRDMGINPGDGITQRTMFDSLKEAIERWEKLREPGADTGIVAREEALFRAASTAAVNLATSMNLREHPDSCECYGCGLNRAVVNFELQAERGTTPLRVTGYCERDW